MSIPTVGDYKNIKNSPNSKYADGEYGGHPMVYCYRYLKGNGKISVIKRTKRSVWLKPPDVIGTSVENLYSTQNDIKSRIVGAEFAIKITGQGAC